MRSRLLKAIACVVLVLSIVLVTAWAQTKSEAAKKSSSKTAAQTTSGVKKSTTVTHPDSADVMLHPQNSCAATPPSQDAVKQIVFRTDLDCQVRFSNPDVFGTRLAFISAGKDNALPIKIPQGSQGKTTYCIVGCNADCLLSVKGKTKKPMGDPNDIVVP